MQKAAEKSAAFLCLRPAQSLEPQSGRRFGRSLEQSAFARAPVENNRTTPEQLTFGCSYPFERGSFDRGRTNQKNFMTSPAAPNDIHIDRVSSAAICEEIADRLRIDMTGEPERVPQHMRMLVQQITQNDRVSTGLNAKTKTAVN
jgi:hypothetical protein